MPLGVLITQCLQRDFVGLLGEHDPVPNPLHVGHREARRLLGDDPASGPVARFLRWADAQAPERLRVIHVRDWHDEHAPAQRAHLARFGPHCIGGSEGAGFAFGEASPREGLAIVDAIGLSDFEDTTLQAELSAARRASPDGLLRVGVIGVWTDAKVTFLLYDLLTRVHIEALATCSALTASASRAQHLVALDQLERLLSVRVDHSIGEFASWLLGDAAEIDVAPRLDPGARVKLTVHGGPLSDPASVDRRLAAWLFRDCRSVDLTPLSGGFSGASVLLAESVDALGHREAPSVLKIGPRADIGHERVSMERVEGVLGNHAPSIVDFGDDQARGAIRFRFASMGRGKVSSFQKLYASGASDEAIASVLRGALGEVLGRLYAAATPEPLDVLADYEFAARWAPGVAARVSELADAVNPDSVALEGFGEAPNVARFYEALDTLPKRPGARHPVSFVHGDLNGQNLVVDKVSDASGVDGSSNVWIIDFGRLRRAHALRDFTKLENDLLYIMTPLDPVEARQAAVLVQALIDRDVHRPLGPPPPNVRSTALLRVWRTIATLRAIAAEVVPSHDPFGHRVGLLRFAAHTLSFDEPTRGQRRWALYACGRLARRIEHDLRDGDRLRVDWASHDGVRVGMTLCPGRVDFGRALEADLRALVDAGATDLVSLITDPELEELGVRDLADAARAAGLVPHRLLVEDGAAPGDQGRALAEQLAALARAGRSPVVHCRAGLGRTGALAAATLHALGASSEQAILSVRAARAEQETWVRTLDRDP